ncbi:MAG: phospholipase D-like domain-containing protein [Candidatus Eremiobacteraeota bacterium]|nr:phospholipase D-like domain-containing protein [Candidatus Eremiobacteraeota bacterium]
MPLELVSHDDFLSALACARNVSLAAYCLGAPMRDALIAAAANGSKVSVVLDGAFPFDRTGVRAAANAALVEDLRAHGVMARIIGAKEAAHTKAAVIDDVAWLDDRNFPSSGPDTLVRDDDAADVAAVRDRICGGASGSARIAFTKGAALALEAGVLRHAPSGELGVATESFGYGNVYGILKRRAERGDHVRLLVDAREAAHGKDHEALAHLARAGVEVRVGDNNNNNNKLAVAGGQAWIGSANATHPSPEQSDWGLITQAAPAVALLHDRFESAWSDPRDRPFMA